MPRSFLDVAARLKGWRQNQARLKCRSPFEPEIMDVDQLKDYYHNLLVDGSRLNPQTECHVWQGPVSRIKVMGALLSVARLAAWVYGGQEDAHCLGLPKGWDLFDPSVRVKAACGNRFCVNFDHLRGTHRAARKKVCV